MPRVPPVGLALMAFGAQLALGRNYKATKASTAVAGAVGLGSAGLMVGSIAEFGRRRTTVNPVTPDASALVTSGPNRLTRNPMYVGIAGLLAAHAVMRRSPSLLVPVALFVAAIDRWQIPAEEAVLRDRFGDAYDAYTATTPRWLAVG